MNLNSLLVPVNGDTSEEERFGMGGNGEEAAGKVKERMCRERSSVTMQGKEGGRFDCMRCMGELEKSSSCYNNSNMLAWYCHVQQMES